MDDQNNSRYSRSPEIEDVIAVCRWLNEQNVQYILIGGFAVILHGGIRGTKDIDLLVEPSEDNIKKIKKALSHLPDNAVALIQDNEVEQFTVVRIADEIVIDLMAKACGIDYEAAKGEVQFAEVEGVKIPVAKKEMLIKMKKTFRPSDKADVNCLMDLIESEKRAKTQKTKL